jgi:hypothetical protein
MKHVWYIWYVVGVVWWLIEGLEGCCHKLMSKACEYWGMQERYQDKMYIPLVMAGCWRGVWL